MCPEGGTGALPRALPVDMDEPIPGKGTALVPQPVKAPVPSIKPALVPKPAGAPAPLKPMPVTTIDVEPVTPADTEPVTPMALKPVTPSVPGTVTPTPVGAGLTSKKTGEEAGERGEGDESDVGRSSFFRKPLVIAIIAVIIVATVGAGAFAAWKAGEDTNEDPLAVILGPGGGTYHSTADDVVLNATGSRDRDSGSIICSWSSDLEGFLGTGMILTTTLSKGLHIITLTVNDG